MKEAGINGEIVTSINLIPKAFAYKIPDSSSRGRETHDFIPARAFDIMACVHGLFYGIETKLIKGLTGLPVNRFTEFEVRALRALERADGAAVVAVAYYEPNATPAQQKTHNLTGKRVRELYLIPWLDFERLVGEAANAHRASIPRAAIVEHGRAVPWNGKGVWGIEEALAGCHHLTPVIEVGWAVGQSDPSWRPFVTGKSGREEGL